MDECIFCKIITKQIPSAIVYEDAQVVALLDITPISKGHTLVLSKNHYRNLFDTPTEVLCAMMTVVKKLSYAVKEATGAQGINIQSNHEPEAGQVIFHHHIHIIPRFVHDGFKHWPGKPYEGNEIEQWKLRIQSALRLP